MLSDIMATLPSLCAKVLERCSYRALQRYLLPYWCLFQWFKFIAWLYLHDTSLNSHHTSEDTAHLNLRTGYRWTNGRYSACNSSLFIMIFINKNPIAIMAEASSRALFTGEQVLDLRQWQWRGCWRWSWWSILSWKWWARFAEEVEDDRFIK